MRRRRDRAASKQGGRVRRYAVLVRRRGWGAKRRGREGGGISSPLHPPFLSSCLFTFPSILFLSLASPITAPSSEAWLRRRAGGGQGGLLQDDMVHKYGRRREREDIAFSSSKEKSVPATYYYFRRSAVQPYHFDSLLKVFPFCSSLSLSVS